MTLAVTSSPGVTSTPLANRSRRFKLRGEALWWRPWRLPPETRSQIEAAGSIRDVTHALTDARLSHTGKGEFDGLLMLQRRQAFEEGKLWDFDNRSVATREDCRRTANDLYQNLTGQRLPPGAEARQRTMLALWVARNLRRPVHPNVLQWRVITALVDVESNDLSDFHPAFLIGRTIPFCHPAVREIPPNLREIVQGLMLMHEVGGHYLMARGASGDHGIWLARTIEETPSDSYRSLLIGAGRYLQEADAIGAEWELVSRIAPAERERFAAEADLFLGAYAAYAAEQSTTHATLKDRLIADRVKIQRAQAILVVAHAGRQMSAAHLRKGPYIRTQQHYVGYGLTNCLFYDI